jgi:hypothetical protein
MKTLEEPKQKLPIINGSYGCTIETEKQETLEEFINSQPYYGSCTHEYKEGIELGAKWQQEQDKKMYSEEEMLKMLHKFGFDYTYNYKGEKTIYEWIPEWFEEHKRLEEIHKNK